MANNEGSALDGSSFHRIFQRMAERILAENADRHGFIRTQKGTSGPLHEFGEVVQKGRLYLIFVERFFRRCADETASERHDKTKSRYAAKHPSRTLPGLE